MIDEHGYELTASTVAQFRSRFGRLHDAVVHSIFYELFSHDQPNQLRLTLGAKIAVDQWVNLILKFENTTRVFIKKPPNYTISIINRIGIAFFDNEVYFGQIGGRPETDPESYRPDYPSALIVVAKRCYWSEAPYQARGKPEENK